ncbi:riboflavin synthase [bacterium BMS3Bbin06]|nr:riboflavin synthase [bacterium BMS3Abin08]GBE35291.1 riboflavin synthase [bacterium BMS3Bbin06]
MFTGIIQELGKVAGLKRTGEITLLSIASGAVARDSGVGDSISVNGACLTITTLEGVKHVSGDDLIMRFDLSPETLRSTTLGHLSPGDPVNLEPAVKPSERLGGHLVTGHIDGVGRISKRHRVGKATELSIKAPEDVMRYIVRKGSVAVDGISLTVVDCKRDSFSIVIIPHTEEITTIGFKGVGDSVNLETDIIGKYVERFMSGRDNDDILMEKLKQSGFV